MNCPFAIKICSKCKKILIANEINFHKQNFYSEERLNKIYEWQKYAFEKWGDDNGEKE